MDHLTPEQRSRLMASIRSRDTAPERLLRSCLHRLGFRFRTHVKRLPGQPDIVLPRFGVAVFVDGSFWHGYRFATWCDRLSPRWREKIEGNMRRDARTRRKLRALGWTVVRVWDHEVLNDSEATARRVARKLTCSERGSR